MVRRFIGYIRRLHVLRRLRITRCLDKIRHRTVGEETVDRVTQDDKVLIFGDMSLGLRPLVSKTMLCRSVQAASRFCR